MSLMSRFGKPSSTATPGCAPFVHYPQIAIRGHIVFHPCGVAATFLSRVFCTKRERICKANVLHNVT